MAENLPERPRGVVGEAESVAHRHLHNRFRDTAVSGRVSGEDLAFAHKGCDLIVESEERFCLRDAALAHLGCEDSHAVAGFFHIVRDDLTELTGGDRKGYKRRGHVELFKRAAHGVLTADRGDAQIELCGEGTEESRERLAPALRIAAGLLEIFLEGEVYVLTGCAGGNQLRYRFHDGKVRALVGIRGHHVGIVAPAHKRAGVGVAVLHGDLMYHRLNGRALILSAERHKNRARADRGVEGFREAALRADVQITCHRLHTLGEIGNGGGVERGRCRGLDRYVLFRTVGIEEFAGDIDDLVAAPEHREACLVGYFRHDRRFKVLLFGEIAERLCILCRYDDCHSLLRFADGEFRAVEAFVFLRNGVKLDGQTVSEFTDRNGYAACAEIVAALDEAGCVLVSKQSLEFSLLGRVALLYLCAARGEGLFRMGF